MLMKPYKFDHFALYAPSRDFPDCNIQSLNTNKQPTEEDTSTTDHPLVHASRTVYPEKVGCSLNPGESLPCGLGLSKNAILNLYLSPKEIEKWTRATVVLRRDKASYSMGKTLDLPRECFEERSINYPEARFFVIFFMNLGQGIFDRGWSAIFFSAIFPTSILLSVPYGLLHLPYRNYSFPSRPEKIMWTAACIVIASGFPLIVALVLP